MSKRTVNLFDKNLLGSLLETSHAEAIHQELMAGGEIVMMEPPDRGENYTATLTVFRWDGEDELPSAPSRRYRFYLWRLNWKNRLAHAWDALRGKECYNDDYY